MSIKPVFSTPFPDYLVIDPDAPLLGKGAYGSVYGVESPNTGSLLAVKVSNNEKYEHIARECEILKILQGAPNTVVFRAFTVVDRKIALVMKRIQYPTLWNVFFNNRKELTADVMFNIAKQGLRALVFYSLKDIIHGDINNNNCFYDLETGEFTICDFGLARFSKQSKWNRSVTDYSAPEIVVDHRVGFGADLWALGVLLFELYTGVPMVELFSEEEEEKRRASIFHAFYHRFGSSFLTYLGSKQKIGDFSREELKEMGRKALPPISEELRPYFRPWSEKILAVALEKEEFEKGEKLVALLSKIFVFENRITAKELLDQFFSASPVQKDVGKRH